MTRPLNWNTVSLFLAGTVSPWLWGWAPWELKILIHSATDQRFLPFLDGSGDGADVFATPYAFLASTFCALVIAIPVAYLARSKSWIFWVGLLMGFILWVLLVLPDFGFEFLVYFLSRPIFPTYIAATILGFWFGSYLRKRRQAQQGASGDAKKRRA